MPIYLIVGITNACNSRCLTCFAWQQGESRESELTLAEYDAIFSTFGKHRLLSLILTGGEVFLRKDLVRLIEILYRRTGMAYLVIPTNAIRYEEIFQAVREICKVYPRNLVINLSLDGIAEMHDKIRGVPGNFEKVTRLYEKLIGLKAQCPRLSLGINTVLNSINQDSYREIFAYVHAHFPGIDQHNIEILRGDCRGKEILPPDIEFMKRETSTIQRLTGAYEYHHVGICQAFLRNAKLHYHDVVLDHLTGRRRLPCYAGSIAGVIDHRGVVYPCELFEEIGNLRDYGLDFRKLWFSSKADHIREKIKETHCACTHSCFQLVNILFNPLEYPRLLKFIHSPASRH